MKKQFKKGAKKALKKTKKKATSVAQKKSKTPKVIKGGLAIKSWKDACAYKGVNPNTLPDVSMIKDASLAGWVVAMYQMAIVTSAINENWEPDYTDGSYKYEPRFWIEKNPKTPSGFGFSDTLFDCTISYSYVGSRLCFRSNELRVHAQKFFKKLYQTIILIDKKK